MENLIIFDLTGSNATATATINCSAAKFGLGCVMCIPERISVLGLNAPLSYCLALDDDSSLTATWAPTDLSTQTLVIANCSNMVCSASCSDTCTCTLARQDGAGTNSITQECPILSMAPVMDDHPVPTIPLLPPTVCSSEEETGIFRSFSAKRCPHLMLQAAALRSEFIGCSRNPLACIGTTSTLTYCILADALCPLLPTPAPVVVPRRGPATEPPRCENIKVQDNMSCAFECVKAGFAPGYINYEVDKNTTGNFTIILGKLCQCSMVYTFCYTPAPSLIVALANSGASSMATQIPLLVTTTGSSWYSFYDDWANTFLSSLLFFFFLLL